MQKFVGMTQIARPFFPTHFHRLARILADQLGETITEVVIEALREKLLREQGRRMPTELKTSLLEIGQRSAQLPDKDTRSADDILGYDSKRLPR